MEQLYLFEVLVDKITFNPTFSEIPDKKEIQVDVTFAHLISLVVESEDMRGFSETKEPLRPDVKIESGKSHLFPCQANELYKVITQVPLELAAKIKNCGQFGRIVIPWNLEIINMVDKSRVNPNDLTPVSCMGSYDMLGEEEQIVGKIDVFIRLSCLGHSVQTQFQVLQRDSVSAEIPSKKYMFFKNSNADSTFKAQKYGPDDEGSSEILPIAPILTPADPKIWFKKGYISPEDMTADNLKKILCKNKHCPGAQKFKQFGLGPAATGKGLGTVYGPTDVPLSYGMSQTYGNMDHYGPYGLYSRPKSLDQPFIPKEPIDCSNTRGCENCSAGNKEQEESQSCCCGCDPLRLTGGAPIEEENKMPVPMVMCKDLMQSFDKVLDAYKKALGPCGKGICPFSQNVMEESCKKMCNHSSASDVDRSERGRHSMNPAEITAAGMPRQNMDIMSACGAPSCPHSRKVAMPSDTSFKNNQMRSGCGSPTCPYSKKRLGTATDEDMIELQLMDGPSVSQPCGAPKCPFPKKPPLPPLEPIHWDCPDPLPKGPCRNPQCPLKPKELRYNLVPMGPCGSAKCPYATPPFCGDPNCPFGPPQPCPFAQPPSCPLSPCYSPQCLPPPCGSPPPPCGLCCCPNPSCPSNPPSCGDPYCPLNPQPRPCPAMPCPPPPCPPPPCPPPSNSCGDPSCPFAPPKPTSPCGNPDCEYAHKSPEPSRITCDNPECPFVTKKESPCFVPPADDGLCENPDCPYKQKGDGASGDVCKNPECPYAAKPVESDSNELCGNPNCPFLVAKQSPCYVPQNNKCPYGTRLTIEYGEDQPGAEGEGKVEITTGDRDPGAYESPCTPRTCGAAGESPSATMGQEKEIISKRGSNQPSQSAPSISHKPLESIQPLQPSSASEKVIPKTGKCRKRRKRNSKYIYKLGDLYPGVHIGHRECIIPGRNVPAKMGWLWNIHVPCLSLKPRIGWRPGAVGRTVANAIIAHRKAKGLKLMEPLTPKASKKKMKTKYSEYESDSDATVAPKPTLQIKKREGCYYITMNPLKDPKTIEDNENPYMDCTPLQFKITKKQDKDKEKEIDDETCTCGEVVENESESSDSELDIEFTPPAGVIRPERLRRKKNVVHTDTQYCPEDFATKDKDKEGKGKGGKGKDKKGGKGKGKGKKK